MVEQLIGRTYRPGQQAKRLVVNAMDTTLFDKLNRAACLNDALCAHQMMPGSQKVITGTYATMPETFPPEVLRERGFLDVQQITGDDYKELSSRFTKKPRKKRVSRNGKAI